MNNARRSNRLEVVMLTFREEYGDDPCEFLIDVLTDARHWCDHNAQSFDELDRQAYRHYLAETNQTERTKP